MEFEQVLIEVLWRIVTEGSISYRRIKRVCGIDDDALDDVARRQNAKSWELRGATSLARLQRQKGRQQEAVALLAQSSPICRRPAPCSTS